MNALRKLIKKDDGATSIEYALLATLIAMAIIVSVTALGTKLQGTYNTVATKLN